MPNEESKTPISADSNKENKKLSKSNMSIDSISNSSMADRIKLRKRSITPKSVNIANTDNESSKQSNPKTPAVAVVTTLGAKMANTTTKPTSTRKRKMVIDSDSD